VSASRIAMAVQITGRVQGVSYRYWTHGEATRLGLSGWVRNEADGSVAALFAGPAADVASMVEICWQGPRMARVTGVQTTLAAPIPPEGDEGAGFHIRR